MLDIKCSLNGYLDPAADQLTYVGRKHEKPFVEITDFTPNSANNSLQLKD